jgi:hypothetical protein
MLRLAHVGCEFFEGGGHFLDSTAKVGLMKLPVHLRGAGPPGGNRGMSGQAIAKLRGRPANRSAWRLATTVLTRVHVELT